MGVCARSSSPVCTVSIHKTIGRHARLYYSTNRSRGALEGVHHRLRRRWLLPRHTSISLRLLGQRLRTLSLFSPLHFSFLLHVFSPLHFILGQRLRCLFFLLFISDSDSISPPCSPPSPSSSSASKNYCCSCLRYQHYDQTFIPHTHTHISICTHTYARRRAVVPALAKNPETDDSVRLHARRIANQACESKRKVTYHECNDTENCEEHAVPKQLTAQPRVACMLCQLHLSAPRILKHASTMCKKCVKGRSDNQQTGQTQHESSRS